MGKTRKHYGKPTQRWRLKKDLVIPAGTEFTDAPWQVHHGPDAVEAIIGVTDDSHGSVVYHLDPLDPKLVEWFEELEPPGEPGVRSGLGKAQSRVPPAHSSTSGSVDGSMERDLRVCALNLAHCEDKDPSEVVSRAATYLRFLREGIEVE